MEDNLEWYSLTNKSRWGISEFQYVVNHDIGIGIKIDINWKWGTFDVGVPADFDMSKAQEKYQDDFELYREFEECQINFLDSGTEEITFWNVDFTEKVEYDKSDEIIELYNEEGWNAFYDNGFSEELDPEIWMYDGFEFEKTESPYKNI